MRCFIDSFQLEYEGSVNSKDSTSAKTKLRESYKDHLDSPGPSINNQHTKHFLSSSIQNNKLIPNPK
jgi:hypothetical protein